MLGARFSGDELMPDGVTHDEMCEFVALAAKEGLSYISISQGCYENPGAFAPDGEGEMNKYGPGFKEASGGLPIMHPNFRTPKASAAAIDEGKTDMVALGRQATADPFWPAKVEAGPREGHREVHQVQPLLHEPLRAQVAAPARSTPPPASRSTCPSCGGSTRRT